MATYDPKPAGSAGNPTLPPVPCITGELTVAEDGDAVLLTVALRLTPDDTLDLLLRALGVVMRLKKVRP